jgi:oligopeptide transport system substrate-binding protein
MGWIVVGFVLVVLLACGRGESRVPAHIFAMTLGSDPETFDPGVMTGSIEGRVAYQIYEGLISPSADGLRAMPGVAERWERSSDGLRWTFDLRSDARWSNGDPVTAEDFRYAWLRQLRRDIPADYVTFLRYLRGARAYEQVWQRVGFLLSRRMQEVLLLGVGVRTEGAHRLIVELEVPTAYMEEIFQFYTLFPVHRATIERHGQEDAFRASNLVTNGPFRMESFQRRNRIRLVQNEHYWGRAALGLEEVHLLIIEDNAAQVTAYLDGRVDWADDPPHNQLPVLEAVPGFHSSPMLGTYYYRFNVTAPPLDDVRVRRALALALNREELCRCTLDDLVLQAHSFVPPLPGFGRVESLRYDPDEARRLLDEAGWADRSRFPTLTLLYNTSENHRVVAQAVQDMWKIELGIDVQLLNQEWKVYLDAMSRLEYQVARAGWIGDYADPNTFLHLWRTFDENNNTGWSNATYDDRMERSVREADPERRRALLAEAEALLLEEVPVVPIYFYSQFHLVQPNVRGWEMNLRDVHLARWISKDGGAP